MTESLEKEFNILGCKVKLTPVKDENQNAEDVIRLVLDEIQNLKNKRPMLRDTDVAVLVALKLATEKLEMEREYKTSILSLEKSLEAAVIAVTVDAN
jgi:cell division protein ZapA (FtsZ GTPase activity inhibitor)